jgi:uncharacterized membrane protein
MQILIGGLALFIAVHLVPTRPSLRAELVGRLGLGIYRGLFSLASIAGLVMIVLGYGHMQWSTDLRLDPSAAHRAARSTTSW